ncbi:Fis family transcriptional regulator [Caballeronia mineralivorans PML1(12)]|uniref:Fis family transcriptional regulator n=1 Tax=Caballeronia mineralivorans PML1(12) TaxID=908627 RepID=A0A0J1FUK1_9BURK|nr:sigma-54 dependent transcriptional regulator [Caballeronia mineralivorans]KLU23513.1 Fis family transcriptional regulator [Caballeronia mineralivorans PML1(12)]
MRPQPDTQRRLICVARAPNDLLLAHVRAAGWEVTVARTAPGAEAAAKEARVAAGLIDFDGFTPRDFTAFRACLNHPTIGWVAITAAGQSASHAVRDLIRNYCFDYVTMPLSYESISHVLGHARGMAALNYVDTPAETAATGNHEMVGTCDAMQCLFSTIRKVANTNASVFICGESGTGKELTALAIHEHSPRRKAPFVAINCGAIPQHLLQSELFGYERGAFTGADQRKIGRIEAANGGTLFLDEIGDMPLEAQVSLLRFLQEGKIERLGGHESLRVDVRVISATHVDLEAAICAGRFRADLFHRLCVLRVDEPPLRARGKDIEILAHHILHKFKKDSTHTIRGFTTSAIQAMNDYSWPGNVRELINRVRRAIVMTEGRLLSPEDLDLESFVRVEVTSLDHMRDMAERSAIETALLHHDHRIGRAAAELRISRVTLYRLMVAHGMRDPADKPLHDEDGDDAAKGLVAVSGDGQG